MQIGNADFIHRNGLDKAYVAHDLAYSESKKISKKNSIRQILRDKTF